MTSDPLAGEPVTSEPAPERPPLVARVRSLWCAFLCGLG
jgi:hypothetical protein